MTLVTGGVRSGKSQWAARSAANRKTGVWFIATAEAGDADMVERIANHRQRRPDSWVTVEVPFALPECLNSLARTRSKEPVTVVIDCVTLWLSNLMTGGISNRPTLTSEMLWDQFHALGRSLRRFDGDVFVVTNEVGLGGIAGSKLERRFADELGRLNQRLAGLAEEVVFMVAGRALRLPR